MLCTMLNVSAYTFYPCEHRAVVGVNTPYFPPNPKSNPLKKMHENPGVYDYQLYFQTPVSQSYN